MIVDLVLFMGQSNMAGRGEIEQAVCAAQGHGYEFRAVTDRTRLYYVREPFGENENNSAINDSNSKGENKRAGGMVSALMESYYNAGGVPMVGVQCSQGGKRAEYFLQAQQLSEAVSRYSSAAEYLDKNGYTIRNRFMVWCQGESDADKLDISSEEALKLGIENYKSKTIQIFNYIENNTGINKEFIICTGHYNYNYQTFPNFKSDDEAIKMDTRYLAVSKAQEELAQENEHIIAAATFYTDMALKNMRDQYHYHQKVYNEVGKKAGYNIAAFFKFDKDTLDI